MARNFLKVECEECGNEQNIYSRASTEIECLVCGESLGVPTGGKAELNAKVLDQLSPE
jgi:small subunit ribosomal protein S27e